MSKRRQYRGDESSAPLDLGETLAFLRLIWEIDHGLQIASKRTEALVGVTGLQRLVIRILGRFPGLSAGQLAGLLHVDPSTLSGVLARLADRDLIDRRSDPRDSRRAQLALTADGRRLDVATEGTVESAVERALKRIPTTKLNSAREVLRALAESLVGANGRSRQSKLPERAGASSAHRRAPEGGRSDQGRRDRKRDHGARAARGS
jgi:DNA-binding MarR family transcriptional regulator